MTSSNGNIFRVTGPLCGEFTGPGEFPAQMPVARSFDVFFDLCLNKRWSKLSWGWWCETLSRSLWRHRNDKHLVRARSGVGFVSTNSDLYGNGYSQNGLAIWLKLWNPVYCIIQIDDSHRRCLKEVTFRPLKIVLLETLSKVMCSYNSLWHCDAIWRHRYGSTLAHVMACCLASLSHYPSQCWPTGPMAFTWGQFHKRYINRQSLKSVWKLLAFVSS